MPWQGKWSLRSWCLLPWLQGVPVCLQYNLSPGSSSLMPRDAFPSPHSLVWPCNFLQKSWKKRKKKHWGTRLVTLPERCPFHAALGKALFRCRVGQGPPFTHLGVLGPHGHSLLQSMNAQSHWIDLPTRGFLVNARVNKHLDYKRDTDMANLVMANTCRLLQTPFILVPWINTYIC